LTVCLLCQSDEGVQEHHVGRKEFLPSVTVPLCRRCHERQTRLQRQAGVFRKLEGEGQRVYSIMHGFQALLNELADFLPVDEPARGDPGRDQRAVLRLLAVLSGEPLGPDPLRSTLRAQSGQRNSERHSQPAETVAAALLQVLSAESQTVMELLPDTAEATMLRNLTDRTDLVFERLAALAEHPQAEKLTEALRRGSEITVGFIEQAAQAEVTGETPLLADELVGFLRAVFRFVQALAGEGGSGAVRALTQFLCDTGSATPNPPQEQAA